jgi:hypothetical protein
MRHFTCHNCGALVFTEKEEGTRCANCLIREQSEVCLQPGHYPVAGDDYPLGNRVIETGDLLVGEVHVLTEPNQF